MKCTNGNCHGLLITTNTIYDEENTAHRRRQCNKCRLVVYTAEKQVDGQEFKTVEKHYYKMRAMKREAEK